MAQIIGDIELDGKSYRVDLATYNAKDIIDFAPRATVPGNSSVMSDLSLYQPLDQTDWKHGMGFHWYSDASGYMRTIGNVDTRHDGLAMMFTNATSSETNNNVKSGFVTFNGSVYSYGVAGLRKYSAGTWSSIYSTNSVNFALNAGDYLFFCPDGARIQKLSTADAVTDAGVDANATDYKWLVIHNGFIYAGKDGTNRVHYDSNADLSQLEGTTADPDTIYCGIGNMGTLGAVSYAGNLYVSRADGLWMIGEDKIARRVLDFTDSLSTNNFRSLSVVNGYLCFPIRDRIVQWNTARTSNITPTRITDEFPYVTYGTFKCFVSTDSFLFCVGRTNETTYTESLLAWDGVGWHKLCDLVTNGTDSVTAMDYDATNNYLWYHVQATTDATYYIPFQNNSSFPYGDFPTTGQHSLISSRLDMGFRRIKKSITSLWVEGRNLSTTTYLKVYYSLDGADWVLWDTVTVDGIKELEFPGGNPTVECNYLMLRVDFVTGTAAQTPILEGLTVRFIMRPDTRMGYSFNIVAATAFEGDGTEDDRTSDRILHDLREVRNSKKPVLFTGLLKENIRGYLTSILEKPVWRSAASEEGELDIQYGVQCSFVEMENAS